jgi:hypothetical protein
MEPAKSCTDAFFIERIMYRAATTKSQMAVCSVPGDAIPLLFYGSESEYQVCPLCFLHCKGLTQEEIAQATGHSLGLVNEYLDLIRDFQIPPLSDPSGKEGFQSTERRKERCG